MCVCRFVSHMNWGTHRRCTGHGKSRPGLLKHKAPVQVLQSGFWLIKGMSRPKDPFTKSNYGELLNTFDKFYSKMPQQKSLSNFQILSTVSMICFITLSPTNTDNCIQISGHMLLISSYFTCLASCEQQCEVHGHVGEL